MTTLHKTRSSAARIGRRTAVALGALAATTTLTATAIAPAHADTAPPVGRHIPATMLSEAACPIPATANDSVLKTIESVLDNHAVGYRIRRAAYEAAWVESHANNLACGDQDSVGVFQQRPSQGWGTVAQIRNVRFAARSFLEGPVGGGHGAIYYAGLHTTWSAGQIAQAVQKSAYPARYDAARAKAIQLSTRAQTL